MIENSGSDLDGEEACKIYYEAVTGKDGGHFLSLSPAETGRIPEDRKGKP